MKELRVPTHPRRMDTGDSGCTHLEGSGCAGGAAPCVAGETGAETGADTGHGRFEGESVCAPQGSAVFLFTFAALWLRRALPLLLITLPALAGVDADAITTQDGGAFPTLVEADLGAPWDPQVGVGFDRAAGLVTAITTDRVPLLEQLTTLEVGASMRFGSALRLGVAFPWHAAVRFYGEERGPVPGDTSIWVRIPLREADQGPLLTWSVQADVPTGQDDLFVGDPDGRIHGTLLGEWPRGPWRFLGTLDLGLAIPTALLDQSWGTRLGWGLGAQRTLVGPLHATLETSGSVGLPPAGTAGDLPVEVDLTAGASFWRSLSVDVGGGFGLTHGLGSPSSRVLLVTSFRAPEARDTDLDGLVDRRDLCPTDPEDRDQIQDADGCPEVDADADQIVDEVDACPVAPEVVNGLRDRDGCPDTLATVSIAVVSRDPAIPVETAGVVLDGAAPVTVLGGDPTPFVVEPGRREVRVEAGRFLPVSRQLDITDDAAFTLQLVPVYFGDVSLRLTEADGTPLAGWFRADGEPPVPVPLAGLDLHLPSGSHTGRVYAEGHDAARLDYELPAGGRLEIVAPLERLPVEVDHGRVTLTRELHFDHDSDVVIEDGLLDTLARWLKAHPEVRLLRVEGHADEPGPSSYNLDLSQRRAAAVVAGLVARGVEAARLEGIGSGEAWRDGVRPSRTVELLVLVWTAEGEPDPPPPSPDLQELLK